MSNQSAINWLAVVDAWRDSGLTMSAYCRQHALVRSRFVYYQRKFDSTKPSTALAVPGFTQVAVLNTPASDCLTLRLVNGLSIAGIDQQNLPLAVSLARALS